MHRRLLVFLKIKDAVKFFSLRKVLQQPLQAVVTVLFKHLHCLFLNLPRCVVSGCCTLCTVGFKALNIKHWNLWLKKMNEGMKTPFVMLVFQKATQTQTHNNLCITVLCPFTLRTKQ